jgi:hypothetical protein
MCVTIFLRLTVIAAEKGEDGKERVYNFILVNFII